MSTSFARLSEGWNADPNAPQPTVNVAGDEVCLGFVLNAFAYPGFQVGQCATLRFRGASRWRLGPPNDEGWYAGQCRFSHLAPAWGELYEVTGDWLLNQAPSGWHCVAGSSSSPLRHFLFYLRDETFECSADDWRLVVHDSASSPFTRGAG